MIVTPTVNLRLQCDVMRGPTAVASGTPLPPFGVPGVVLTVSTTESPVLHARLLQGKVIVCSED